MIMGLELVELVAIHKPMGDSNDAFVNEDDPTWRAPK